MRLEPPDSDIMPESTGCALELSAQPHDLTLCAGIAEAELQSMPKPMRILLPRTAQVKPCFQGASPGPTSVGSSSLDPVDASILERGVELETCDREHPRALIPRIVLFRGSMSVDYSVAGRDLARLLDRCGDGGDRTPRVRLENRVEYELSPDHSFCQAEFSGDPGDPDLRMQMHQLLTIRGRKARAREGSSELYEYFGMTFHVPETDWPHIGDLVRASARSFSVDWNAMDAWTRTLERPTKPRR